MTTETTVADFPRRLLGERWALNDLIETMTNERREFAKYQGITATDAEIAEHVKATLLANIADSF